MQEYHLIYQQLQQHQLIKHQLQQQQFIKHQQQQQLQLVKHQLQLIKHQQQQIQHQLAIEELCLESRFVEMIHQSHINHQLSPVLQKIYKRKNKN